MSLLPNRCWMKKSTTQTCLGNWKGPSVHRRMTMWFTIFGAEFSCDAGLPPRRGVVPASLGVAPNRTGRPLPAWASLSEIARIIPCLTIIRETSVFRAQSAIRIPISCERCCTEYESIPYTPIRREQQRGPGKDSQ